MITNTRDHTGTSSGLARSVRVAAPVRILRSCLRSPARPAQRAQLHTTPGRHNDVAPAVETFTHEVSTPMVTRGSLPDNSWKPPKAPNVSSGLIQLGRSITQAKYLEYHLHGTSTLPWPVVWTTTQCLIYLPPSGRRSAFLQNRVHAVESWRVTRPEGIAMLVHVWDSLLHVGHEPNEAERSSLGDCSLGLRLSPSVFDVRTPIVDEDEDGDDGLSANDVVLKSSERSGVHLRMPPSSRPAAGTKRVVGPAGGSYPPLVTSWLVDSGCPLDLIDRSHIQGCTDSICDGSKVTLATANGDTESSEVLPLYLNKLKEKVQPHVLNSTPNVLSLGRRVIVDGYSFEWPAHSYSPWLVHPTTGEHIHLRVKDFVPYLEVAPNDAELREPWGHESWAAAPSLPRDDGTITNMENLLRAVDTTPVARLATAAPGPGGGCLLIFWGWLCRVS